MRWVARLARHLTWVYFTRLVGIAALGYEVLIDKVDKPSVMIVVGAMILGTEGLALGRRKPNGSD